MLATERAHVTVAAQMRRIPDASFQPEASDLEEALATRQLCVYYQPKIACSSGALAGFEALVRWQHPEHGLVVPDRFVPLAERDGLIDALTDQVIDQSLGWFAGSDYAHREPRVSLSVNLSARTLRDQAFVERLVDRCASHAVDPEHVILELTETSAMEDPVASLDLLTRLRMKGFRSTISAPATPPCCNSCDCRSRKSRWTSRS